MGWESEERRKFVRVRCPCKINIIDQQCRTISTQTENISAGGIRVLSRERLIPNTHINLEIYLKNNKTISCKARVVWMFERTDISSTDSMIYDTGIEFSDIAAEDIKTIEKLVVEIASGEK